jgi:5-(carboxyamino)imidazole ribonucleotide mutase
MRLHVIFGSPSDSRVFEPLCTSLRALEGVDVCLNVCSCHREPDRLREILTHEPADLLIAGAGLSAALPGVIASHVHAPVIGIPVGGILNGWDALLSILQMPKGLPVLCAGVEQLDSVVRFIKWYSVNFKHAPPLRITASPDSQRQAGELSAELGQGGWHLAAEREKDNRDGVLELLLSDLNADSSATSPGVSIGVPLLSEPLRDVHLQQLRHITDAGGLWVGVNNLSNLKLMLKQLWPGVQSEQLTWEEKRGMWKSASI